MKMTASYDYPSLVSKNDREKRVVFTYSVNRHSAADRISLFYHYTRQSAASCTY